MAYYGSTKACFQYLKGGRCSYGSSCKFSHNLSTAYRSTSYISDSESDDDPDDVAGFFNAYSGFEYNERKDVMKELARLCRHLGYDPDDDDDRDARRLRNRLRTAMVRQFNDMYGTDEDDLGAWQALCRRVDIPVPDTLEECQEAIRGTHVNLVDLTTYGSGRTIKKYDTEVALANYTKATGKFFPRDHIDAGDLLKNLLRHIMNPRPESVVRGIPGVGRRRRSTTVDPFRVFETVY